MVASGMPGKCLETKNRFANDLFYSNPKNGITFWGHLFQRESADFQVDLIRCERAEIFGSFFSLSMRKTYKNNF